ncbi:MAG: hypothetical protein CL869_00660 [Cytophagia bacterium]|nr:hypothetical protein [Cytophagia bacterium]|tara:strand:- start:244 stop:525 length:282 start_codon:yes stop_codon:yes gene_type:complete
MSIDNSNYICGNKWDDEEKRIVSIFINQENIESFENYGLLKDDDHIRLGELNQEVKYQSSVDFYRYRIYMNSGIIHDNIVIGKRLEDDIIDKD